MEALQTKRLCLFPACVFEFLTGDKFFIIPHNTRPDFNNGLKHDKNMRESLTDSALKLLKGRPMPPPPASADALRKSAYPTISRSLPRPRPQTRPRRKLAASGTLLRRPYCHLQIKADPPPRASADALRKSAYPTISRFPPPPPASADAAPQKVGSERDFAPTSLLPFAN